MHTSAICRAACDTRSTWQEHITAIYWRLCKPISNLLKEWTIRKEQGICCAWYFANKDNDLTEELCETDTILSALKTAVNNLNGMLAVDVCTAAVEFRVVWDMTPCRMVYVYQSLKEVCCPQHRFNFLPPWRWRPQAPPKRWNLYSNGIGIIPECW